MPYTCPHCHLTSHHPKDAEERYCARCRLFEDEARTAPAGLGDLQQRRNAVRKRLALMAAELLEICADADVASADALLDIGIAAGRLDHAAALLRQPTDRR